MAPLMNQAGTTTAATVVLALTAIITAIFTLVGIYQTRDAKRAGLLRDITKEWNGFPFRESRREIEAYARPPQSPEVLTYRMCELRETDAREFWQLQAVFDFFEELAMLVKCHAIPIKMVDNSLGAHVCGYWYYVKPYVGWAREIDRDPAHYAQFEKLAKRISRRHGNQGAWAFEACEPTEEPSNGTGV
jgi:hypothetical protein